MRDPDYRLLRFFRGFYTASTHYGYSQLAANSCRKKTFDASERNQTVKPQYLLVLVLEFSRKLQDELHRLCRECFLGSE